MKNIDELRKLLASKRPEDWNSIPDIDLYMDQIISYMKRQHIGLELDDGETLTSAMINNYIKSGLLPRANGKRYNRDHIGYLTAICLLKQVVSVGEAGVLINSQMENQSTEEFYNKYVELLDEELGKVSKAMSGDMNKDQLTQLALHLAVSSYAEKLACQQIIKLLDE